MEKPRKIVFSVVAVLLYWLAASGFSDGVTHRIQVDQVAGATGSHEFLAEELPSVLGFAINEGTGVVSAFHAAGGSVKQPQLYRAVIRATEVQVSCAILRYVSQFYSNPVRIRKSDMLFPFHYFFEPARA